MRAWDWGLTAALVGTLGVTTLQAQCHPGNSGRVRRGALCGTLLDFTGNGQTKNRIYSPALGQYRDLYVYLPPGYRPDRTYPLMVWLHGFSTDERVFACHIAEVLDRAMACGRLRPMVVAAPDGSVRTRFSLLRSGSWYVNSHSGRFADYVLQDVIGFIEGNFSVSPDRAQRVVAGFSMGGFGAYSLAMEHPDRFHLVAGVSPCLNLRYVGRCGRYMAEFEPGAWRLRQSYDPLEVVGRFYGGLLKVRAWRLFRAVTTDRRSAIELASQHNPVELLLRAEARQRGLEYYVAYGKMDEMNIDAQVESFLEVAQQRGVPVDVQVYPDGNHSIAFMVRALPGLLDWVNARLPASGWRPAAATTCPGQNR